MRKGSHPSWTRENWEDFFVGIITEHYLEKNKCPDCWGSYDSCPNFRPTGRCEDFDAMVDPWIIANEKAEKDYKAGLCVPRDPARESAIRYLKEEVPNASKS